MLRGKERCECDLDRKSIGIVAGVGLVAMVCAAAAVFYWKRWNKMKRVAQEARIETRVLSQVLENKAAAEREEVKPEVHRGGNAPGEGDVSEEVSAAAPPQYSESPQYSEPPQYSQPQYSEPGRELEPENNPQPAGKTIQEDDDVVGHDNIYIDMDYDDGVVGASIV